MAGLTKTEVTAAHMKILEYAASYYEKYSVGPLYQNIKKKTGYTKKDIDQLFPHGLTSVYAWVGIPVHSTNSICKPIANIQSEHDREVYMDHSATTYLRDEVKTVLMRHLNQELHFGNPSSSTELGKQAYMIIQEARNKIGHCLKVDPMDVLFVSGGTEGNNLAIKGVAFNHLESKGHIITSKIEHPSIINSVRYLESIGFEVTWLDVTSEGTVTPESVKSSLKENTILVSIMAVNNEIGSQNPLKEIGDLCKEAGVPFMVDATQGFGKIRLHPKELGISLMTFSGHKIYAPKGVGALYIDSNIKLTPLLHGGEQEFEKRAGTENTGSILAFGKAAQLACHEMKYQWKRLEELRAIFLERLREIEPDFIINGPKENYFPYILNIGFPKIDSGALLLSLNQIGIYVSSGSACTAGSEEESHVLQAIRSNTRQYGSIRFSFGLKNTIEDLDYLFFYLPEILDYLKKQS